MSPSRKRAQKLNDSGKIKEAAIITLLVMMLLVVLMLVL
jgi:hypothetical protein